MRVFICFEGSWESFDVPPDQRVGALKQKVKNNFLVQLSTEKQYLEMSYAGATLQDSWALCDAGIRGGSTIHCLMKSEQKPVMCVFNAVTGETLPIMGRVSLLNMSVARLQTLVSVQSRLPVGTFRLSTSAGVQLYDCNQLQDYAIKLGTILHLDTWDGWVEYLQGCLLGHRLTVQSHLSEDRPVMRFQLRVALYIAASLGHLELAGWLLKRGVHADEPVGVHPHRQWCLQTAHRDAGKCPIHAAAESSQLLILKLFITKKVLTLACRDPGGRDPLKIAIQHGHKDCVCYLVDKLCSVISLSNISLPMRIYLQVKRWMSMGQRRLASDQIHRTLEGRVGETLLVDGFNQPKMSSKPWKAEINSSKAKALHPLPPINNMLPVPHKRASLHLPHKLTVNPAVFEKVHKKPRQSLKNRKGGPLDAIRKGDSNLCGGKFPLPPINSNHTPREVCVGASPNGSHCLTASLESVCHHSGRTPRENAVYCLSIASTFTEKPWSKQLSIARKLARKHIQTRA